jgi:hypothetical protein
MAGAATNRAHVERAPACAVCGILTPMHRYFQSDLCFAEHLAFARVSRRDR